MEKGDNGVTINRGAVLLGGGSVTSLESSSESNTTVGSSKAESAANGSGSEVCTAYGAYIQLAVHGQENKWWMLYVFLMFNSILLLSCAALFAVQQFTAGHRLLLLLFSSCGIFVNVCWILMASDYVKASDLFSAHAVRVEALMPAGLPRPCTERAEQRAKKNYFATSAFLSTAIPLLLSVMYCVLIAITWQRSCG